MATGKDGDKDSDKKNEKKLTGNFQISVENNEGKVLKVVLKPPNRFVVQAAMSKMTKATGEMDMIGAGEIVYKSCKISCDKGIEEDDTLLVSIYLKCFEIVEIKEATLVKI